MKKLIIYFICLANFCSYSPSNRNNAPVNFSCYYPKANDSDLMKLLVENATDRTTYYYAISVEGLSDTGWVILLANVDALGKNEWFGLKTLPPAAKESELVSKKRVFHIYRYMKIKKIRFNLIYGEDSIVNGKEKILYAYPP